MDPDPQPQRGTGSGSIIDEQGHIVTNNHVVANARSLTVRLVDGREYNAELVGTDPATDIALIRITPGRGEQLPVATFGDSDRLRVGDWVLALGNPLGLDFSVTAGIVSAKGRRIPGSELQLESFIQTDAAINMGNSGGPMVDLLGRVVGVNTAIFGGGNRFVGYGFAVPSTLVQKVVSDIKTYGHARRPKLGAYVSNVTPADVQVYGLPSQQGAEISSLEAGEAAERAGLRVGDVVVAVDAVAIANADDFITTLARHQPGDRVRFTIYRDRQRRDVTVQLGEFARPRAEPAVTATGGQTEQLLGFTVSSVTPQVAQACQLEDRSGVVITNVRAFSSAESAGVGPCQTIREVNGQAVRRPEDVARIAGGLEPGSIVSMRVRDPRLGETLINYQIRR
jgi:serine protease Do